MLAKKDIGPYPIYFTNLGRTEIDELGYGR